MSFNMTKFFFAAVLSLSVFGCVNRGVDPNGLNLMTESEFNETLDAATLRSQQYSGLYNTMDVTATLMTTAVSHAQVHQKARLYEWDKAKFQMEMSKTDETMKSETQVFMSFFTPERKNDDLNKDNSQWRIYLESGGRRWEGKVVKIKKALAETQGVFPYHNRFATPYLISFTLPTTAIDSATVRYIVTGPVGIVNMEFKNGVGVGTSTK